MKITLTNDLLDNFQLKNHEYLVDPEYYDPKSGEQEYRLYSYLTTLFNNIKILDIGTYSGRSAVSLSHNDTNHVISYNIIDQIRRKNHKIYTKENIEFRVKDVLEDLNKDFLKDVKIIVLDIDHFGNMEKKIIDKLEESLFSGILLLDDIHHPNKRERICMEKFFNEIEFEKYDITKYGHISGTGLVLMNTDIIIDLL